MTNGKFTQPAQLSVALRTWNEEAVVRRALHALFSQSLFAELHRRRERCEIICIADGCTDRTAAIAAKVLAEQSRSHPFGEVFSCRVEQILEVGQNKAWNLFVHEHSDREAKFLFVLDSGIAFNRGDSLFDMYAALLERPEACVASDRRIVGAGLSMGNSLFNRISIAAIDVTGSIQGRLAGRPYCMRADVARRIWLPKDLEATDEDFIKAIVCTDFLTRAPRPHRVIVLGSGSHVHEVHLPVREILNSHSRRIIARTTLQLLIKYLKCLPLEQRTNLAATLRHKDETDSVWLKWLIEDQLSRIKPLQWSACGWDDDFHATPVLARVVSSWNTCEDSLTLQWRNWRWLVRVKEFPAAVAAFAMTLIEWVCSQWFFGGKRSAGRAKSWSPISRHENIAETDRACQPATAES